MAEHIRCRSGNDWAEWFLIHAIVEAGKHGLKVPAIPENGMMVSLVINGVECPVMDTLKYLETMHDEVIGRKVQAHIDEHLSEKFLKLEEIFDSLKDGLKDKIREVGIKLREEDEV